MNSILNKSSVGRPKDFCGDDQSLLRENLKIIREVRNVPTQIGMDRELGLEESNLGKWGKWERGDVPISDKHVKWICERLEIDICLFDADSAESFRATMIGSEEEDSVEVLTPGKKPVPILQHNLPVNCAEFIGREKEISELLNFLSHKQTDNRCAINGTAGIGKSTLAKKVAWTCFDQGIFDCIVWFSTVKSIDTVITKANPAPLTLDTVLSYILKEMSSSSNKTHYTTNEKLKLANQLLRKRNSLFIIKRFDIINDPETISFINRIPHNNKVLITTRKGMIFNKTITLHPFSHQESTKRILSKTKLNNYDISDNDISDIANNLAGIPAAIDWFFDKILHQHWDLHKIHSQLQGSEKCPLLDHLFFDQWVAISDNSKFILTCLGAIRPPIPGIILKEILSIDDTKLNDSLIELQTYNWITTNNGCKLQKSNHLFNIENKYQISSLSRHFIRKIATYQHANLTHKIAKQALNFLHDIEPRPHWPSRQTITLIKENILFFKEIIISSYENKHYNLLLEIMKYIHPALILKDKSLGFSQKSSLLFKLSQVAVQSARQLKNNSELARNTILGLGWALHIRKENVKAKKLIKQGIEIANSIKDNWLEAVGWMVLGIIAKSENNYKDAHGFFKTSAELFTVCQDNLHLGIVQSYQSSLAWEEGNILAARKHNQLSIKKLKIEDDSRSKELLLRVLLRNAINALRSGKVSIRSQSVPLHTEAQKIALLLNHKDLNVRCERVMSLILERKREVRRTFLERKSSKKKN